MAHTVCSRRAWLVLQTRGPKAATEQESALKLAQQEAADYDKQIKAVDSERKLKMEEYMKEMNSMHEQAAKMEKVNPNKYLAK